MNIFWKTVKLQIADSRANRLFKVLCVGLRSYVVVYGTLCSVPSTHVVSLAHVISAQIYRPVTDRYLYLAAKKEFDFFTYPYLKHLFHFKNSFLVFLFSPLHVQWNIHIDIRWSDECECISWGNARKPFHLVSTWI